MAPLARTAVRGARALSTAPASVAATPLCDLLAAVAADPDRRHVVLSTSRSPYANLALEQRLLERAHPDGRLLLMYRNDPCVVIGRNQNPWAEVHLTRLRSSSSSSSSSFSTSPTPPAHLVRRRSGGGAVYHDVGNANWSVLGPAAGFDRDRHAWMVARALQRLGVASARVNARHDLVVGSEGSTGAAAGSAGIIDRKISGSAYKLTSRRALHHGTCLLGTDLAAVAGLLRSPAAAYVQARGVASVRSPVQNVFGRVAEEKDDHYGRFVDAVVAEFELMYGPATRSTLDVDAAAAAGFAEDARLARGYAELQDRHWLFGQTPQFAFSTLPTESDPRSRPPRPRGVSPDFQLAFVARHGRLQDVSIALPHAAAAANAKLAAALDGQLLYEIDWAQLKPPSSSFSSSSSSSSTSPVLDTATAAWLNELFGVESKIDHEAG